MKNIVTTIFIFLAFYAQGQIPFVTSFSPSTGAVGTLVTIKGTDLKNPTSVAIANSFAIIISSNDTQILAMVMPTTNSIGNIAVANANGGSGTYTNFTVTTTLQPNVQQSISLKSADTLSVYGQGYSNAISADGNTAVVGCPNNFGGSINIYRRQRNKWVIEADQLHSNNTLGSLSFQGGAVDISADGNTIIVGNYKDSNRAGAAHVFVRNGTTWTEQAKLIGTGAVGKAWMGFKVAISADGNTALLGGYRDNANIGATWVFIRNNGVWTQSGTKLVSSNYTSTPSQGRAVAISANGKYIIVGGPSDNNYAGRVWIYSRSGNTFSQQYFIYSNTANAYYGWSVSINADGSTIAVGQPVNGNGKINIFNRSGTTWNYVTDLTASDGTSGAELGWDTKISADGTTILAAADYQDYRGAFYLYKKVSGNWTQQGNARYSNNITDSAFATSVAMSGNGNTAIVSCTDANNYKGATNVYVSQLPRISDFDTKVAQANQTINITGIGFTGTNKVTFGGKDAYSFTVYSDTLIIASVNYNSSSGRVVVTNNYGVDSIDGFIYCNQYYYLQQNNYLAHNSDTIIHAGANILFEPSRYNQLPPDSLCSYKWYKNNMLVGNKSTYLDSTLVTGDSVYCVINFNTPCVSISSITTPTVRFKVLPNTPYKINSIAGSTRNNTYPPLFYGDGGQATSAALANPSGIALDKTRNILYIADRDNFRVRKVNLATGIISTYAGGGTNWLGDNAPAIWAGLGYVNDVAVDKIGNVYIATYTDHRIRKVDTMGIITTVAGDGTNGYSGDGTSAVSAQIGEAAHIALDNFDNLYIADRANHVIRKVDKQTGIISTIAGKGTSGFSGDGGQAIYAKLSTPEGITFDKQNNLLIADRNNGRIRKINASNGFINTVAGGGNWQMGLGDGQPATWVYLNSPNSVAIDTFGNMYISDELDNRIRKVAANTNIISTVCGQGSSTYYYYFDSVYNGDGGPATAANIAYPDGIITDNAGNVYFADSYNSRIRKINFTSDTTNFIAGNIISPKKAMVNGVSLLLKKENGNSNLVVSGSYSVSNNNTSKITIRPSKNNDITKANGVTTADVVLVQRHILNLAKLNNAYKLIAADVTNDKQINSTDIIRMKRLILGLDTTFTGNRLWAFVDSAYQFPDTTNPFPYKDSISFTNLTSNKTSQTFIGLKLGDVNYDWNANVARQSIANSLQLIADVKPENFYGVQNPIKVAITTNNFKQLNSFQYTLHFDNSKYEFVNLEGFKSLQGLEWNATQANQTGNIAMLWANAKGEETSLEDGSLLFELILKPKKLATTNDLQLTLTNDITDIEAWDKDFNQHNIILENKTIQQLETTNNKQLFTVAPNPTSGSIRVNVAGKINKTIVFELSDIYGKIIMQEKFESPSSTAIAEANSIFSINLNKNGKLPCGIYFLKAVGLNNSYIAKIVIE